MIPANISESDILKATQKVQHEGYPSNRESDDFEMVYQRDAYPPKLIISYANLFANGIELNADTFNSSQARQFLIANGFPIRLKTAKNPAHFFTNEELDFFQRYADQPYQPDDAILRNAGNFIRGIHDKTRLWAERVSAHISFNISGRAQWNDRAKRGQSEQRIRNYTWYKIHDPLEDQQLVYYTVGISGTDKQLIVKIDCQRSGTNALQSRQVDIVDTFLKNQGIAPLSIPPENLSTMDWDKLVKTSTAYINQHLSVFRELVKVIMTTHKEMCARICWNTEGWVRPSGPPGKSRTAKESAEHIQERDNGFGPEEWLFDLEKLIDGYHYARIEPLNSDHHIGKVYNITLFSRNSIEKMWYWVGKITDAIVITKQESEAIVKRYRSEGWLKQQRDQLASLPGVNTASFDDVPANNLFNLKFRPENVDLFDMVPFAIGERTPSAHYNLPNKVQDPLLNEPAAVEGLSLTPREGRQSTEIIVRRSVESNKELPNVHGEIQDHLVEALQEDLPDVNFFVEVVKIGLHSRVDLVGQKKDGSFLFFEIKTYPGVLQSIRVAVGQLLEYALYPSQDLTSVFYIVTHLKARPIHLSYLRHLGDKTGMEFHYIYFDRETKRCTCMR